MKKISFMLLAIMTVTSLLVGCQAAPATTPVVEQPTAQVIIQTQIVPKQGPITIGYGAPSLDTFQTNVMISMGNYAQQKGWAVITSNANQDAIAQANEVDYWISLGVNAIVVVPVDSQAICASVKKATDAGIPFFTIDRAPIGCKVVMTVQSDNALAGKQDAVGVAAFLKQKYGDYKGTVLELQGDMGQNVAQLRSSGFVNELKQYPNITIVQKATAWDSAKFQQATLDVVGSQQVDAIYMHSDTVGSAPVFAALDQLGKKKPVGDPNHIFVASIDGSPTGLQFIRDGWMDMMASQPGPDMGILTDYIDMTLKGTPITAGTVKKEGALWSPATIVSTDTGWQLNLATTVVTKANVDDKALWGNLIK